MSCGRENMLKSRKRWNPITVYKVNENEGIFENGYENRYDCIAISQ